MAEQDVATIEVAIQKVETEINNVENQIVMIEGLPGDHPDKARLPTIRQKEAALRRGWAALREEKAAREQKEAALQQEKVLLLSKEGRGGPSGIGPSTSYKNITVVCTTDDGTDVRRYQQVTRARLQHLLDNADCDVYDPSTQGVRSFDLVHLEDNMVITTVPYTTPMITRVQNLEGFPLSVVQAGEDTGTEALANILRARCTNVKRTDISIIKARSGKSRQLDGVVLADGAVGILESELGLSEKAVEELDDKLQFINEEELVGDAAVLKGKKLMGFLAGTVPLGAPERARKLFKTCQQRGYGVIVTSGTSMALGKNSRIPRITPPRCIPMGLSRVHM